MGSAVKLFINRGGRSITRVGGVLVTTIGAFGVVGYSCVCCVMTGTVYNGCIGANIGAACRGAGGVAGAATVAEAVGFGDGAGNRLI